MILRFGKKKIEEMESRAQQALACLNALEQKVERIEKATDCLCEQMQNLQQELKDITELMNHAVQTQASDTDRLYQIMEVQAQKLTVLDEKQNAAYEKTENVALCLQGVAEKARQMAENQEKNKDILLSVTEKLAENTEALDAVKAESTLMCDTMNIMEKETRMLLLNSVMDQMP